MLYGLSWARIMRGRADRRSLRTVLRCVRRRLLHLRTLRCGLRFRGSSGAATERCATRATRLAEACRRAGRAGLECAPALSLLWSNRGPEARRGITAARRMGRVRGRRAALLSPCTNAVARCWPPLAVFRTRVCSGSLAAIERGNDTGARYRSAGGAAGARDRGSASPEIHDSARESLGVVWDHCCREGVDELGAFPVAPELVEALVELGES